MIGDPRPLRDDDAEPAAETHRVFQEALGYRPTATPAELREWWRRTDLDRSSWAFEDEGRLVGLAWLALDGDTANAAGFVAPSAHGRGVGAVLCDLVETRSRELGAAAIHQHAYEADEPAAALFTGCGYAAARRFYDLEVDLGEPPPEPVWPDGVAPSPLGRENARAFYDTTVDAFREDWGFVAPPFEEWVRLRVEEADTACSFLACAGDDVVGAVRGDRGMREEGYIGTLGVRAGWRGRGVGRALLLLALHAFRDLGDGRVGLGVDAENPTGALHLYESVGFTVTMAGVVYAKQLSPSVAGAR